MASESCGITLPSVRSASRATALTSPFAPSIAIRCAITCANVRPDLSPGNGSPRISLNASVNKVLLGRPEGFGLAHPRRHLVVAPIAGSKSFAIACLSPVFRRLSTPCCLVSSFMSEERTMLPLRAGLVRLSEQVRVVRAGVLQMRYSLSSPGGDLSRAAVCTPRARDKAVWHPRRPR